LDHYQDTNDEIDYKVNEDLQFNKMLQFFEAMGGTGSREPGDKS